MSVKDKIIEMPSTVILDETHNFAGTNIHFYIDAVTFNDVLETIFAAIKSARKLMSEEEIRRISVKDPIYKIAYDNLDGVPDDERVMSAIRQAHDYYLGLLEIAKTQAFYLALISKNVFESPATPYEPTRKKESVLGVGQPFPEIECNLAYPIERRYKQLFDVIKKDFAKWQSLLEEKLVIGASIAMKEEKDPATGNTF